MWKWYFNEHWNRHEWLDICWISWRFCSLRDSFRLLIWTIEGRSTLYFLGTSHFGHTWSNFESLNLYLSTEFQPLWAYCALFLDEEHWLYIFNYHTICLITSRSVSRASRDIFHLQGRNVNFCKRQWVTMNFHEMLPGPVVRRCRRWSQTSPLTDSCCRKEFWSSCRESQSGWRWLKTGWQRQQHIQLPHQS